MRRLVRFWWKNLINCAVPTDRNRYTETEIVAGRVVRIVRKRREYLEETYPETASLIKASCIHELICDFELYAHPIIG